MKKVLFIYPNMMMGGSTISLLALMGILNKQNYEISIIFYNSQGELIEELPSYVKELPLANNGRTRKKTRIKKLFSPVSIKNKIEGVCKEKSLGSSWVKAQYGNIDNVRFCRKVEEEYDIAISYLEFWPLYYLSEKINAKKKIAWIHTNYKNLKLDYLKDEKYFDKMDRVVLVSQECKESFLEIYPQYSEKVCVIENFVDKDQVIRDSKEKVEDFYINKQALNFVTTCRIDFASKGLDRAVSVLNRLNTEGMLEDFFWYIIGDGADYEPLKKMIDQSGLTRKVLLLGGKRNPFPYMKDCDAFFLPSRFEGKPMAVTEAACLGLALIVTNYVSAHEQVKDGVNGLVFENDMEAIYEGMKNILNNREVISEMKKKGLGDLSDADAANLAALEQIMTV